MLAVLLILELSVLTKFLETQTQQKETMQEGFTGQSQIILGMNLQEIKRLMKAPIQNLLKILKKLISKKYMMNCLKNLNLVVLEFC